MKTQLILGFLGLCLIFVGCSTPTETETSDKPSIIGRWKLSKEETKPISKNGVIYEVQPTRIVLNIQKSGYFVLYDTFIDPSWKKKGLPLIQERSKGQWVLDGESLTLNHSAKDSNYTEKVQIELLDNTTLKTKGSDKKSNTYKTYGR